VLARRAADASSLQDSEKAQRRQRREDPRLVSELLGQDTGLHRPFRANQPSEMTAEDFRKLALGLPEAVEDQHMGHPDFRIRGKIFATIGPGGEWGMVKLSPEQQAAFVRDEPEAFQTSQGAWGRGGATKVCFENARPSIVRPALLAAWRNTAPKSLLREHDGK
jgi:hypothetical protein